MKKFDIFYIITMSEKEFKKRLNEETKKRGITVEQVVDLGGGAFTTEEELGRMKVHWDAEAKKRRTVSKDEKVFIKAIEKEMMNREYIFADEVAEKEEILGMYGYKPGDAWAEKCFAEAEKSYLEKVF